MIGLDRLKRWGRRPPAPAATAEPSEMAEAVARTHVGKIRTINEDRFLVRTDRGLWAVADGMGGHADGGAAADAAMQELARAADEHPLSARSLRTALNEANSRIRSVGRERQAMSGSTVVAAWLSSGRLTVFWAGDSRAYLRRGGEWRCLTRDHTVVQELIDAGEVTAEAAAGHRYSHLVTRALGAADALTLDEAAVECRPGDCLLLCSDGVSRSLDLAAAATPDGGLGRFADGLLDRALEQDGSDNATLVVVRINCGEDRA
jgi:serine/threonine-protein phosphatase Stp1